ncbi:ABC transporter permease [Bradyrhizobium sp. HKCCYLRH3099]|uniref:ABC transporter permease n=1 Tax=unclassified Bradyrhizobium TaxID=2631580 RepID=UPI003EBAF31F
MIAIAYRIMGAIVTLAGVSLVLFVLVHTIPVSPARVVLGADASEADVAEFDRDHGLDRPLWQQYASWIGGVARGDFGNSVIDDTPISSQIADTFPVTFELVVLGFAFSLVTAIPLGVLSALYEGRAIDQVARVLSVAGVSIPSFWLGLMLIAWGAVALRWFPAGGYVPWRDGIVAHLQSMTLPAIALGIYYVAIISRMTRSAVADVLRADHVRVAQAMGLPRRRILTYVLKNALPPVVTVSAMSFGYMFGWSLIVEQVFNIAGMSRALLSAIFRRDYLMIENVVLVITAVFIAANALADLLYTWLDPRLSR